MVSTDFGTFSGFNVKLCIFVGLLVSFWVHVQFLHNAILCCIIIEVSVYSFGSYTLLSRWCVADDDECRLGTHNCGVARDCHNIEGSFRCVARTCPRGYRLDFDTGSCDPIICPRGRRPDDAGNCVGKALSKFRVYSFIYRTRSSSLT